MYLPKNPLGQRLTGPRPSPTKPEKRIVRFHDLRALMDETWTRYVQEMGPVLRQYNKWHILREEPKLGDVVAVLDEVTKYKNQSSDTDHAVNWKKRYQTGRIIEVRRGTDELIRTVVLKYKDKIFERPITRIYVIYSDNTDLTEAEILAERAQYRILSKREIAAS